MRKGLERKRYPALRRSREYKDFAVSSHVLLTAFADRHRTCCHDSKKLSFASSMDTLAWRGCRPAEVKAQMSAICGQLGMTTSTAFHIFANAFVRAKGMPFAVTIAEESAKVSREKMLADTDQLFSKFAPNYKRQCH